MNCGCPTCGDTICSCCTGAARLTPARIANRDQLPAIAYRVGTWSSFFQTMQAALSSSIVPALAGLRTRSDSDFSIALADAWSEVLDILTFYTERLANEAWLGTAIEGRSIFELARLVGYRPSPGVSAATVLAFTLASSPGSPAVVAIPAGTRVQSVPGPGQTAQVFETAIDLTATIAGNAIAAATTSAAQLSAGDTSAWIDGTANTIKPSDMLAFVVAPGGVPAPTNAAAIAYVTGVMTDPGSGKSLFTWDQPLPKDLAAVAADVCLYVFRTKAALYGVTAIRPGFLPWHILKNIAGHPAEPITSQSDWAFSSGGGLAVQLDAAYAGLNPTPATSAPRPAQLQWAVLTNSSTSALFLIAQVAEANPGLYGLSLKTSQVTMNAAATPLAGATTTDATSLLADFVKATRDTTVYVQNQLLTLADPPLTNWSQQSSYPLAPGMLAPACGDSLTVTGLQTLGPQTPVGISGKRIRIAPTTAQASFTPFGAAAGLTASANHAFLVDAFPPTPDPTSSNVLWSVLTAEGLAGTLSVAPGKFQLLPSASADPLTSEAALVAIAQVGGATTALTFGAPLARIYDMATVAVNANAVAATHGETTQEILGSGDATNPALEFQLKQSPLTYTSAPNANGVQSSLQLRVNTLLWTEVANFLDSAPTDRAYVTEMNATGGPNVLFGDGLNGSRVPTGVSNIQALYRVGTGAAGMVAAGQLTQLLDRPQGLQMVTNPSAATGGADPATPAQASQSASLETLTLGRVVSLEDYQNFALNIPGIKLALATWTWLGTRRGVFLTVAGAGGATINSTDQIALNLQQALATCGLPNVPVQIISYVPVLFEVALQVQVDAPVYDPAAVIPLVWQALGAAFTFGRTSPGQGVAASQIIEIAQQIAGVVAVNLLALNRSGDAAGLIDFLCAAGPQPGLKPPRGAEVLLLDPACQGNVVAWT